MMTTAATATPTPLEWQFVGAVCWDWDWDSDWDWAGDCEEVEPRRQTALVWRQAYWNECFWLGKQARGIDTLTQGFRFCSRTSKVTEQLGGLCCITM